MSEILDLIVTLMKSTGNYVHSRMYDDRHQKAYRLAMTECIKAASDIDDLERIKTQIAWIKEDVVNIIKPTFFNKRTTEIRYYLMACDHAEQVVLSIEKRFITGGADSEPRAYKMGGYIYEDKSVF